MENIKTYVINMKKDVEKRLKIESQLKQHPYLDFEIFTAIEGGKLSDEEKTNKCDLALFNEKYGFGATLPALGCSLSHYNLYIKIFQSEDDFALVLEDDALIGKEIEIIINELKEQLIDKEPKVILLTPEFRYNIKGQTFTHPKFQLYKNISGIMTSGYLINKNGAKLLVDNLLPIRFLADDYNAFKSFGLNVYGIVPHFISYPNEMGEIGKSVWEKQPLLTKLKRPLGKLKIKYLDWKNHKNGIYKSKKLW